MIYDNINNTFVSPSLIAVFNSMSFVFFLLRHVYFFWHLDLLEVFSLFERRDYFSLAEAVSFADSLIL